MKKHLKYNIRDILNQIKWTKDISEVKLWYIHRGAPNNIKLLSGYDIVSINAASLDTKTSTIPYHRIVKIIYDAELLFKR